MVTGVETAGLVLGAIPLILAGLQFYVEGIDCTKRYWKYKECVNTSRLVLFGRYKFSIRQGVLETTFGSAYYLV